MLTRRCTVASVTRSAEEYREAAGESSRFVEGLRQANMAAVGHPRWTVVINTERVQPESRPA
jgi:hypothetical protein